jgi:hypothetical protein
MTGQEQEEQNDKLFCGAIDGPDRNWLRRVGPRRVSDHAVEASAASWERKESCRSFKRLLLRDRKGLVSAAGLAFLELPFQWFRIFSKHYKSGRTKKNIQSTYL